jgi:hypothetical protein
MDYVWYFEMFDLNGEGTVIADGYYRSKAQAEAALFQEFNNARLKLHRKSEALSKNRFLYEVKDQHNHTRVQAAINKIQVLPPLT